MSNSTTTNNSTMPNATAGNSSSSAVANNSTTVQNQTLPALQIVEEVYSDSAVSIVDFDFDGNGAEIGFFFVISLIAVLLLLNQLNGRVFRLKTFLLNRDYHLVKNPRVIQYLTRFIRVMSWFALTVPFLALFVWTAGLIVKAAKAKVLIAGGICVFMVGAAYFCLLTNFFRLRWNNYSFDVKNGLFFGMCFVFLTVYQFVAVFVTEQRTVFGLNVVFLSLNCLVMIFAVFLNTSVLNGSIEDLINAKIPNLEESGKPARDPRRTQNFEDEINEEKLNKEYNPSQDDILDLFSLGKPKFHKRLVSPAYGPGLQNYFGSLSDRAKFLVTLLLWCIATGILVIYSFVMKKQFPSRGDLGFILMIAILTTDVLLFFIHNAHIVRTATPLSTLLFINRFFLIIFGGDYWVYGYIVIYLCYGLFLAFIIAKRRFPIVDSTRAVDFESLLASNFQQPPTSPQNVVAAVTNNNAAAGPGGLMGKGQGLVNRVFDARAKAQKQLVRMTFAEYPLAIITVIYVVILLILTLVRPKNIPLPRLQIQSADLHFFVAYGFIVVLVVASYSFFAVVRLFLRRRAGTAKRTYYVLGQQWFILKPLRGKRIYRYWVFMGLNLASVTALGFIGWHLTGTWATVIIVSFIDCYMLLMLNFYSYFIANDYSILENIDKLNVRVRLHNQKQDNLKKEIADTKARLGLDNPNLSQKEKIDKAMQLLSGSTKPALTNTATSNNENQWANTGTPVNRNNTQTGKTADVRVQPRAKVSMGEEDKIIEEEISRIESQKNVKNNKEDEIYEGGEAEVKKDGEQVDLTEVVVDPDEEEALDESKYRIKYKEIIDWRQTKMNPFQAFFKRILRANDYQIIFSQLIGIVVLGVGAWLICEATHSWIGITIMVPLGHYTFAAFSHMKTLHTDVPMSPFEYFCFFAAYGLQYSWGLINLRLTYGHFRTAATVKKDTNIYEEDPGVYIVVNLIVIPFITSAVVAALKWIDSKGKMSPFLWVQLGMALAQGIAMLVCAFVYMTWVQGVICSAFIGVLAYIGFQVWLYNKNEQHLPRFWFLLNMGMMICAVIAPFVASLIVPDFQIFEGFSISTWLLAFLLFAYGGGRIIQMYLNLRYKPVFFSPWVFPIYRFDPRKQDVIKDYLPAAALITALVIMIGWSALATVWFQPTHAGVALCIVFEFILLLSLIFMIQMSQLQLLKVSQLVDGKILRRAWLESKTFYVKDRQALNRNELVTYEEYVWRNDVFRNKIRLLENRTYLTYEERHEGVHLIKEVNDDCFAGWLDNKQVDWSQQVSQYQYLSELEKDLKKSYKRELELIILFQLLIIAYTEIYSDQKKKFLFTFLIERRPVLLALDIVINIPANAPSAVQYAKVADQIANLPTEQLALFNDLREQFVQEQRVLDDKRREAAAAEEEKVREREKAAQEMKKKRKNKMMENTPDKPVEQWADCFEKYQRILKECTSKQFTDPQFKPDASALGPNCANRGIAQWARASQKPECVLFRDTITHLDVTQGALGDCYFLSAISVLGEKNVREMIRTTEEEWRRTGCFCVRFYRDGEEEFVIVDDHFPVNQANQWAFVKGGNEGDELWPMVLEKAYAKFYGSFTLIEAGKVQYALADMVQGFPEQVDLKKDGKNLEVLWEKMKSLKRQGALIGAGSPENAMGDAAINQLGIVQGHAYAVIDIQEVDNNRLVQLRNPHGKGGAEWLGDWCDTCPNWTQRMKNKLAYEPRDHEDGVFWMDAYDFVQQYSYLYICRVLSESMGWKRQEVSAEWSGSSAEGLPSRANPGARLELNPQFALTLTKPCDGYILLKQKEADASGSTFKGKQQIFFIVQKSKGKPISKIDKDFTLTSSGAPTNLMIVSTECQFDKTVSYPYTFTILVANMEHGAKGEGSFDLTIYSTDTGMVLKQL